MILVAITAHDSLVTNYYSLLFPPRWLGDSVLSRRSFGARGADGSLHHFILPPVVLPLQRLQIGQLVPAALRNWHNMVDLPTVSAAVVSIVGTHNGPAPRVNTQGFVDPHRPCLLPNRLNHFGTKRLAGHVRIRLPLHGKTFLIGRASEYLSLPCDSF
jgi:hypothetical protein